ncbi:unnamed protein product [Urochloa humidicola]
MAGDEADESLTEYERQRLARIRENEARLEALGLRGLAASPLLRNPSPAAAAKEKQKKRSADEDEEYVPSDDGRGENDEEDESSSGSGQDDEMDGEGKSASRSRAKAIALSLVESSEKSATAMGSGTSSTVKGASEATSCKGSAKNRKIKMLGKSRIQLTEDDVVAFFFSFDEVGKGYITPWDLERMATINDFIWTDYEISKMIRCFDSDGDGKINLEDFRSIVSRCNMLQEPEK